MTAVGCSRTHRGRRAVTSLSCPHSPMSLLSSSTLESLILCQYLDLLDLFCDAAAALDEDLAALCRAFWICSGPFSVSFWCWPGYLVTLWSGSELLASLMVLLVVLSLLSCFRFYVYMYLKTKMNNIYFPFMVKKAKE